VCIAQEVEQDVAVHEQSRTRHGVADVILQQVNGVYGVEYEPMSD